jgi:CubicO group peptidase (beta-lactamase class C family)
VAAPRRSSALVRCIGLLAGGALIVACSSDDDAGDAADGADGTGEAVDEQAAEGDGDTAADVVYPGDEWARGDAAELGFDVDELDAIAARAEAAGSNCLVVTRHGEIAGEWYWNDTDASSTQEVFSVTKSITSALVGIARADGDLDVTDPAADHIEAWAGTPSEEVTIEDLLGNDSGREWSFQIDYSQLIGQPDLAAFATELGQDAPPGESWAYNNAAIQTLDVVLSEATGRPTHEFAAERLFAPLGMDDTEMTTDDAGGTRTFMGAQSSCEDLARFGYLFLRDGEWDGTEVVPEEWVDAAVGRPSQDLNDAYGYLWWLNRSGTVLNPAQATTADEAAGQTEITQFVPDAPEEMYFALGLNSQIVAVDPTSDTVVVRLGGQPPEGVDPFGAAAAASVVTDALVDPAA